MVNPDDGHAYAQPVVTLNPVSSGNVVIASETDIAPTAAFTTSDQGKSWSSANPPMPAAAPNTFSGSPWPAFDASGKVYDSYLTADRVGNTQLVASGSSDGGVTWGQASVIAGVSDQPDKNETAVDTTAGPFHGRVYVGYDANPPGNTASQPLMLAWSTDGGTSWSKTQVYDSGGDFGAAPVVGANGDVFIGWDDYCGGVSPCSNYPGQLLIARSTNGGAAFSTPARIAATRIGFGTTIANYSSTAPSPPCPLPVSPGLSLAVDRTGGAHNGTLYAVWADQPPGGNPLATMHIYFAASVDNGALWSPPVQVDSGNLNDAWDPTVSVDQSTGAVSIAWYDRRDDPNNSLYRVYYTQSTDGGMTFLPKQLAVADRGSSATLACFGTGLAMGLVSASGSARAVWTDTRNSTYEIFTATVNESLAGTTSAPHGFAAMHNLAGVRFVPGKFAGDGHVDLLGWSTSYSGLSLLAGNGDGTFRPPTPIPMPLLVDQLLSWIVTADINRDGKPDLIFRLFGGSLYSAVGNGDGTFQTPTALPMPSGYSAANMDPIVTDVNGDGIPDLVVALQGSGNNSPLVTLFGNGDGTFRLGPLQSFSGGLYSLTAGDFNGDGKVDLALGASTQNAQTSLVILLGDGQGNFTQSAAYDASVPTSLVAADINHDGRLDLVVSSWVPSSNTFQLLSFINSGGSGQALFNPPTSYPEVEQPIEMLAADFNNDGFADIAWVGTDKAGVGLGPKLTVMTGSASGALSVASQYDVQASGLAGADLFGSGHTDLLVGPALFQGKGDGTFVAAQSIDSGSGHNVAVVPGDFNHDGRLDAAVLYGGWEVPSGVSILLGKGDGSFQKPVQYSLSTQAVGPLGLAIADFNGDGIPDIAALFNGQVYVFVGNGDGTFKAPVSSPAGISATDDHAWIAAGELDGDARTDLIVADGLAIHLLTGNGDATFTPGNSYTPPSAISAMGVADLNNDGKPDVVVSSQGTDAVVYLGNGDGTLRQASTVANMGGASAIAFGDFTSRGRVDALFTGPGGTSVAQGLGDGSFQVGPTRAASIGGQAVTVGDFTGSGHLDLALVRAPDWYGGVLVLRGNGDGTFSESTRYNAYYSSITSGDFNGDGQTDLAATVSQSGINVLLANKFGPSIDTASLTFGTQAIGTTAPTQTMSIANHGTAPMPLSLALVAGPNSTDFSKSADTCSGLVLLPGRSCAITIGFSPRGAGARAATLNMVDGISGSPRQFALSGNGAGAVISLKPGSLQFGNRLFGSGSTPPQTVTVSNSGNADAHIGTIGRGGSNPSDFQMTADGCSGITLVPGGSCSFAASFSPTAMGRRSATVSVPNDAFGNPHLLPVAGAAVVGGPYTPLQPARVLDTRVGPTPPGWTGGKLGPNQTMDLPIAGQGGVPADGATAVFLNVTVTNPTLPSALTIYPTGTTPRPTASNLNFVAGQTVANLVEVALGANGSVSIYNGNGATDVIVDVAGFVSRPPLAPGPAGFFNPLVPSRILDTRDANFPLAANSANRVQIGGWGGVPLTGAGAVVLNVTVTGASAPGYVTVWPDGAVQPNASNLNFGAGQTVQNRVVVKLPSNGVVDFYIGGGGTHLILDVGGWFTDGSRADGTGSGFVGTTPARVLDTRTGNGAPVAPLAANSTMLLTVAGRGGVPAMNAATPPKAVILNVTVTNTTAPSYLIVYPSDATQPLASDLNWVAGMTVPNLVLVKLGSDGRIAFYNAFGSTDVVIDVFGYTN